MKTAPLVLTTLLLRFVSASSLNLRAGDEAVKIVGERILTNDLVSLDHLAIVLLSYISSILIVIWCLSTSLRSHTSPQLLVSLLEVSCYLDNACRHSHLRFNLFQVGLQAVIAHVHDPSLPGIADAICFNKRFHSSFTRRCHNASN